MKILLISSTVFKLPPVGYSGLEQLVAQQAVGLAQLGHQVTVAAPDGSDCPGCSLIPTGPAGGVSEHQAFQRYEPELTKYDVIISHDWQKWALLWKQQTGNKVPVLNVCHAPVNTMYGSMPAVERPCFVCISDDQASHFRGLFERDCRVAKNGVDTDVYSPLGVERFKRFLFLARFSTVKSPDLCIRMCYEAGEGLDLVGDTSITNEPDYLEHCKWLAGKESPSWGVRSDTREKQFNLLGGATRGECVWHFSKAKAFLHLTPNFREPLGLAPLESQACETPVVAWKRGALQETVLHGETGWLVSSEREAVEAIKECNPTPQMRKKCREWVCDNFTVDRMVRCYDRLIHEAAEGGGW